MTAKKRRTRAEAFNEWMRLYIENPAHFEDMMTSVNRFLVESRVGREPTYGEICDALLAELEGGGSL